MASLCNRKFQWQRAVDGLHAIPAQPERVFPGDEVTTLCGVTATLTRADFTYKLPSGEPAPTCQNCTTTWIAHESRPRGGTR